MENARRATAATTTARKAKWLAHDRFGRIHCISRYHAAGGLEWSQRHLQNLSQYIVLPMLALLSGVTLKLKADLRLWLPSCSVTQPRHSAKKRSLASRAISSKKCCYLHPLSHPNKRSFAGASSDWLSGARTPLTASLGETT